MNQIKLKRIGSEIAQELSKICATEAHDELLKSITITGTEVTNDLGLCKVFFTTPLDRNHKSIEKDQKNEKHNKDSKNNSDQNIKGINENNKEEKNNNIESESNNQQYEENGNKNEVK